MGPRTGPQRQLARHTLVASAALERPLSLERSQGGDRAGGCGSYQQRPVEIGSSPSSYSARADLGAEVCCYDEPELSCRKMFERCLICTDLTDGLQRLVDFVPSLAATGLKHVVFFHSTPLTWEDGGVPRADEEAISAARAQLTRDFERMSSLPDGFVVEVEIASGRPQDTVPRIVRDKGIDTILVGTPIRSLLEEKIFGSTSVSLTQAAVAPLTILRPQLISTYTQAELDLRLRKLWSYLLLPYDGSASAKLLVERLQAAARKNDKSCCVEACLLCWVVDDAGRHDVPIEPQVRAARETLEGVKQELEAVGFEVHCEVRTGDLLQELLSAAMVYDITAVAVVEEERNAFLKWTSPTLGKALLRSSWHPVLFFPTPKK